MDIWTGGEIELGASQKASAGRAMAGLEGEELDGTQRHHHLTALAQTIEAEIIPRLLLAHRRIPPRVDGKAQTPCAVSEADLFAFADLVTRDSAQVAIARCEGMLGSGLSLEALYLDVFAPTARLLGEMWIEDVKTFADVTIGLGTLQQVLRHFSPAFAVVEDVPRERTALLVPAPGEQHTFGLLMVEAFLHKAGWRVEALSTFDADEVQRHLTRGRVDLVGLTASSDRFVEPVRRAIAFVRAHGGERLPILVGGEPFGKDADLCRSVGASATALDAQGAVAVAEELVPPARLGAADRTASRAFN